MNCKSEGVGRSVLGEQAGAHSDFIGATLLRDGCPTPVVVTSSGRSLLGAFAIGHLYETNERLQSASFTSFAARSPDCRILCIQHVHMVSHSERPLGRTQLLWCHDPAGD